MAYNATNPPTHSKRTHHPDKLMDVPNRAPAIIEALGLEAKHLYRLP